jgi:hypothetical protein
MSSEVTLSQMSLREEGVSAAALKEANPIR